MSIYTYSPSSPLRDILFRYANDRPPIALLEAGTASDETLSAICRAIASQGWSSTAASMDGKDVLQVQGFKDEGQLAAFLHTTHFTNGNPQITAEAGDHP